MPGWLWIVLGPIALALVTLDIVWVTLTLERGGWLTRAVSRAANRTISWLVDRSGWKRGQSFVGPAVVLAMVATWVALSWFGWFAVFSADELSLVTSETRLPATAADRAYFIGFSLITLGMGDVVPSSPTWQLLTVFSAIHGFFIVTLSITYLIPVVGAVVKQRTFAVKMSALGKDPAQLVATAVGAGEVELLTRRLESLGAELAEIERYQVAYPVLAYYRGAGSAEAMPVAAYRFVETCFLLDQALAPELAPPRLSRAILRELSWRYASTVKSLDGESDEPPPMPELSAIPEAARTELPFDDITERWQEARRLLYAPAAAASPTAGIPRREQTAAA